MLSWRILLYPFSVLYGAVLWMRHSAYNAGFKSSQKAPMKTLVFGNIAVGGTGKTPHAANALLNLNNVGKLAFLSRGYGRTTKGFRLIDSQSTSDEVGDEPLMLASRFPEIPCFVGEDRLMALKAIQDHCHPDIVVLDDALQHRRLIPDCAVLLTTWDRPYFDDVLLPAGRLRDLTSRVKSAHAVIVSKCPSEISEKEKQEFQHKLRLTKAQAIFFTGLQYGTPKGLHGQWEFDPTAQFQLVSGIANPHLFQKHVQQSWKVDRSFEYPDHHTFSTKEINQWMQNDNGQYTNVLTTEKDAMRLKHVVLPANLRIFYVPIDVQFIGLNEQARFNDFVATTLGR
jgi:tetraacyldisaccharide 4'-kinase